MKTTSPPEPVLMATLGPDRHDIDPAPLSEIAQTALTVDIIWNDPAYNGQNTVVLEPDLPVPFGPVKIPTQPGGPPLGDWNGEAMSIAEAAEILDIPPARVIPLAERAVALYRDATDRAERYEGALRHLDPGELCRVAASPLQFYEPEFEHGHVHLPVSRYDDHDPTMTIGTSAPQFRDATDKPIDLNTAAALLGLSNQRMLELGYTATSMLRDGRTAYERPTRAPALQAGALAAAQTIGSTITRDAGLASHSASHSASRSVGHPVMRGEQHAPGL